MRIPTLLTAAVSLLVGAACSTSSTRQESDVEAVTQAIRGMADRWDAGVNAGELDFLSAHYTEDAVKMPNYGPAIIGIDGIREWLAAEQEEFALDLADTVDEVNVAGDWAFARSSYTITLTPRSGGDPIHGVGKWMAVYKRQADGSWKTFWDMFNSSLPRSE